MRRGSKHDVPYGITVLKNGNGVPPEKCNRGHGGSKHDMAYGFLVRKKWNGDPPERSGSRNHQALPPSPWRSGKPLPLPMRAVVL